MTLFTKIRGKKWGGDIILSSRLIYQSDMSFPFYSFLTKGREVAQSRLKYIKKMKRCNEKTWLIRTGNERKTVLNIKAFDIPPPSGHVTLVISHPTISHARDNSITNLFFESRVPQGSTVVDGRAYFVVYLWKFFDGATGFHRAVIFFPFFCDTIQYYWKQRTKRKAFKKTETKGKSKTDAGL